MHPSNMKTPCRKTADPYFRDESFQAISCAGTDNQTHNNQEKTSIKHKRKPTLRQTDRRWKKTRKSTPAKEPKKVSKNCSHECVLSWTIMVYSTAQNSALNYPLIFQSSKHRCFLLEGTGVALTTTLAAAKKNAQKPTSRKQTGPVKKESMQKARTKS